MLRKLLGKDTDAPSATEEVTVSRLAASYRRLLIEGGRVNTKSEAGFNACALFLDGLDMASRTMHLEAAPRSYRVAFTINYRALFPDEARNYRVDVLEASVEQYAVIWVNGDKFEFSAEAMRRAEALQRSWAELGALLERWTLASEQPRTNTRPTRSELRSMLVALDTAWASFEHKYIAELIEIEEKARRLIVQAIEHERALQLLEANHSEAELEALPEYREEQQRLVASIAHLNSVANFRRKGRDDLGVDVLCDAVQTLRRCSSAERGGKHDDSLAAAHTLATDVVESFAAMRDYLHEVERCLERVDPHLCNNLGLVARLVDWEESWEVGTRYVQREKLLDGVCDIVAAIQVAQRLAPALTQMCEDCDVELFLVLPRIIWLRFLAEPAECRMELLKSLLPHRFAEQKDACGAKTERPWDGEVDGFLEKYRGAVQALVDVLTSSSRMSADAAQKAAWETLMLRVISKDLLGPAWKPCGTSGDLGAAQAVVEALMYELERFSIELQRHCPEDWNQCSAILVQCLSGGEPKQKPVPFRV